VRWLFPLFLAYIFPKLRTFSILVSFVLFIFWKSPFSEGFIDFYNQISPIAVARVVDYTDFIAFVFLIIPFLLIKYDTLLQPLKIRKISPALVFVPSVFVMMATSPPPYYRYAQRYEVGQIYVGYLAIIRRIYPSTVIYGGYLYRTKLH